jgi:signal transduction histidine kinase
MADPPDELGKSERMVTLVHDLRTPLAIVIGFAELLDKRGEELTPTQRHEYIERVSAAAAEIRDLLDAERAGRVSGRA